MIGGCEPNATLDDPAAATETLMIGKFHPRERPIPSTFNESIFLKINTGAMHDIGYLILLFDTAIPSQWWKVVIPTKNKSHNIYQLHYYGSHLMN
ncbi:hypothetical protein EOK75_01405 [Pseudorhodobacter turbinis]|uniref:Uncharacterized protein n=1 Tax=Pseudorhodobacter turbinis TaxID=2500533 RepID=A0A4P8ECJ2_9RHOB|nr:hypothetical protein [Pseudorhodobacter turbinis]QCO54581.1 hypothetical protein EOK75_01405 [Pseudorhodobacter turbinis]